MFIMDAFFVILIAVIVSLLVALLYYLVLGLFKHVKHQPAVIYRWRYYRFATPVYQNSKYYRLYALHQTYNVAYCPTTDDATLWSLASQLSARTKGMTDKRKASFLLAFAQQNVRYVSDESQYGENEHWALPVNTLMRGKGDCEDSAFLFSCFASLCGLDVITVEVVGHMLCAVNVGSVFCLGSYVTVDGQKYYYCETTSFLPFVGLVNSLGEIQTTARPATPTAQFVRGLRPED